MKKILKILVILALIIFGLYSCSQRKIKNTFISTVKDGYFSELDTDVTVGKMLKTICDDSKWDYEITDTGQVFVCFRGVKSGKPIEIDFFIQNFAGEMVFLVNRFKVNDAEVFGDEARELTPIAIYKIYTDNMKNK